MRTIVVAAFFLNAILLDGSLRAQPVSADDSLRILRTAQHAQWEFERRRRFALPAIYTSQGAPCDLIGRFCLRHGGVAFERIPIESLDHSRAALISALDGAAALIPGDDWIAGQRVKYLVEGDDRPAALRAARACRGTQWWCAALTGLALHVNGEFSSAEVAFERALSQMPREKRCDWTDLTYLLEESFRSDYSKRSCEERTAFERRVWLWSDPLFLTPGNERRSEHFARHVWAECERFAVNAFWMPWGPDFEEMVVRFGWSEKWTREPPTILETAPPIVNGHEHEPNYHFLPEREPPTEIRAIDETLWNIGKKQPLEAFAPRYAKIFERLQPQVARFRRGDSTLILAAFRQSDYDFLNDHQFQTGLAVVISDSVEPVVVRATGPTQSIALWAKTNAAEAVVSVETLAFDSTVASRWRALVTRPAIVAGSIGISDLFFFEPSQHPATDVFEAATTAYGTILNRGRSVGIYWELYGRNSNDTTLTYSLTISPMTENVFKRAAQAFGVGRRTPIVIKWQQHGPGAFLSPNSLAVDISLIPSGTYEFALEIGDSGKTIARRIVEIH